MAGPELTEFLAAGDFKTYRDVAREFNHDAVNTVNPITAECSILIRIIEKFPPEEIFSDPEFYDEAEPLVAEAKALVAALTDFPHFFKPAGDEDESITRERWKPYDDSAWDKMLAEYGEYLNKQLQAVLPLFERLKELEEEDAIRPDGKGAPLLKARYSISACIGRLETLLTPEEWEARLDKWLEQIMQKA